ncbi:FAD-dependent monooxygenase [Variovorax sp. VNK109]|uniref:FAD-dependent monooxygenase n=1 Tax=Variovorax sp. VNK109 TaxID=3400919 RepID=UPI003C117D5F
MPLPVDICIRGAGIVGRTLALLLAREKLRVALVEQAPATASGHSDVRAYALNAASRKLIESLRAWPDENQATPVVDMEVSSAEGATVHFHARDEKADALTWIVDVPALESKLAEAIRYQPQIEVVAEPVRAALTVVCEGKSSRTRDEFGVDFEVTPYAQHAIATRLECEKPHGQVARQWFAGGTILAFLPLGGPQGNSVAVVWSVEKERVPELLALEPAAFAAELHAASHGELGALELSGERVAWPLQLAMASRWTGRNAQGSWALAGDAAHNVHPLAGQGLNLGLADVAELTRVLRERAYWRSPGDERLLRQYARARRADTLAMGLATDGLQQVFARQDGMLPALRSWGMKGFDHSGWIKAWVAKQAMGLR